MNASVRLLHSVLPTSVSLRTTVPTTHPSAQVLATERLGSGTLVDQNGMILTVNYVALGADSIEVTLGDQTKVRGEIVAQDFFSGLAVIKIPISSFAVANEYASDQLQRGQEVFIVASAGNGQRRVNSGAIFSLDPFEAFWEYQLDRGIMTTAMNPGFGGGGLFTMTGQLAGVVALDFNDVGRSTFAIPADQFFAHRDELLQHGRRVTHPARAWVGFFCYVLREHLVVAGVLPGAPSDRAGLRSGDVILTVNGAEVSDRCSLYALLWKHKPGDVIRFQIFRNKGVHEIKVEATDAETFFA